MTRIRSRLPRVLAWAALCAAAALAQAPSNNGCSTPIPVYDGVNPIPPEGFSGNLYTNVGATNSAPFGIDCAAATHFNKDVFFSYVSSFTGDVAVGTCTPSGFSAGTLTDTVVAVYAITACPAAGAPLACDDDTCGNLSSLTFPAQQGQSYLIRVGSWSTTASGTFYLTVAPQMPNDLCANALPLPAGTSAGSPVYTLGSTYGMTNTANLLACGPPPSADVWYSYSTVDPAVLHVGAWGLGVRSVAIYKGGCPSSGQAPDACAWNVGSMEAAVYLAAGETARVRVRSGATFEEGTFSLGVWADASSAGDFCANPVTVTDGLNPGGGATYDLTTTTEFGEPSTGCADVDHLKSKWFRYVSSITGGVEVSTCTLQAALSGALDVARVFVYAADCQTLLSGCPTTCSGGRTKATFAAQYGVPYLIRVTTTTGASFPDGGFQLTVLPTNRSCATAQAAAPGTLYGSTADYDAFLPTPDEAYYVVTAPVACVVDAVFASAGGNLQVAIAADCASVGAAPLGANAQFVASAGVPFTVRVLQAFPGAETFALDLFCSAVPPNDEPAGAIALSDGVNPLPPGGSPLTFFSSSGATTSVGLGPCAYLQNDVFFLYEPDQTKRVRISLCPVAGLPAGSLADPVLEVYAFGNGQPVSPVGCVDDVCGLLPELTFVASPSFDYMIRVGQFSGGAGGTFRIVVDPQLTLWMPSPLGPGSLRIDVAGGEPFAPYLTVLTLNAGTYPHGPFFGIAPSTIELLLQVQAAAPPFVGGLDASGSATFGPAVGLPPFAIYGVSLAFDAAGYLDEVSAPTNGSTF